MKLSSHFSSPSKETNSKITDAEPSIGKFRSNDGSKNILQDKSLDSFLDKGNSSLVDINNSQTSFLRQVLESKIDLCFYRAPSNVKMSISTIFIDDSNSSYETASSDLELFAERASSNVKMASDTNFPDDSNSSYETASSDLELLAERTSSNVKMAIATNFKDGSSSFFKTASADLELFGERATCNVKMAIDTNFQDDSNSSCESIAPDLELFSVSDTSDTSTKSLDNKSNSNNLVDKTPWLVKKYCDQLYSEAELKSFRSLDVSILDRILGESCNLVNTDKSLKLVSNSICQLNVSEELSSEMQLSSKRSDSTFENSGNQFHNSRMVLKANNDVNYKSKIYSDCEVEIQNFYENSRDMNYSENHEKIEHTLKNSNDSDFQFDAKEFSEVDTSILLYPKDDLGPEFPSYKIFENVETSPYCIQTESNNLCKKSYSIAMNEVKNRDKNACLISHQPIDKDPVLDGICFTSSCTHEVHDYFEEKLDLKKIPNFDSSSASFSIDTGQIKKEDRYNGEKIETSPFCIVHSIGSPNSSEGEIEEPDVDGTEKFSSNLSDSIDSFSASETKNNFDKNSEQIHEIHSNDYQASGKSCNLLTTITNSKSESEIIASNSPAKEMVASKRNFSEMNNCCLDAPKINTAEELDKISFAPSNNDLIDRPCSGNYVSKKCEFSSEFANKQIAKTALTDKKTDSFILKCSEFPHNDVKHWKSIQSYSEEGENLVAAIKTNCHKSGESAQQDACYFEKIAKESLSNSARLMRTVADPSVRYDIQLHEMSSEKQNDFNYLGLLSAEPKSDFPCKPSPKLNSTTINPPHFSGIKGEVNSEDKKFSFENRHKRSKSFQSTEREISEIWQVKTTNMNATFDSKDKIIPPLILKRSQRMLALNTKCPHTVSEIGVTNKKSTGQSNRGEEINCKAVLSSTKIRLESANEHLNGSGTTFSERRMDNVKRVFEVLNPRNRTVSDILSQPIHFSFVSKAFTAEKTIDEEINPTIQSTTLLTKGYQSNSEIFNARKNSTKSNVASKQPDGCLADKFFIEESKTSLKSKLKNLYLKSNVTASREICNLRKNCTKSYAASKQPDACPEEESRTEEFKTEMKNKLKKSPLESDVTTSTSKEISNMEKRCTKFNASLLQTVVCLEKNSRGEECKAGLKRKLPYSPAKSDGTASAPREISNTEQFSSKLKVTSNQPVYGLEEEPRSELFKTEMKKKLKKSNVEPDVKFSAPRDNDMTSDMKKPCTKSNVTLHQPVGCLEEESCSEFSKERLKSTLKNSPVEANVTVSAPRGISSNTEQFCLKSKVTSKRPLGCLEEEPFSEVFKTEMKKKLENSPVEPNVTASALREISNTEDFGAKSKVTSNGLVGCLEEEPRSEVFKTEMKRKLKNSPVEPDVKFSALRDNDMNDITSDMKKPCTKSNATFHQPVDCVKDESRTEECKAGLKRKLQNSPAKSDMSASVSREISNTEKFCSKSRVSLNKQVGSLQDEYRPEELQTVLKKKLKNSLLESDVTATTSRKICTKSNVALKQPNDHREEEYRPEMSKVELKMKLKISHMEANVTTSAPGEISNTEQFCSKSKVVSNRPVDCLEEESRIKEFKAVFKRKLKNSPLKSDVKISASREIHNMKKLRSKSKATLHQPVSCLKDECRPNECKAGLKRKLQNSPTKPDVGASAPRKISNTKNFCSKSKVISNQPTGCLEEKSAAEISKEPLKRKLRNCPVESNTSDSAPRKAKTTALVLMKESLSKRKYQKHVK